MESDWEKAGDWVVQIAFKVFPGVHVTPAEIPRVHCGSLLHNTMKSH